MHPQVTVDPAKLEYAATEVTGNVYYLTNNATLPTPPYFEDDAEIVALQQEFGANVADFSTMIIGETLVR